MRVALRTVRRSGACDAALVAGFRFQKGCLLAACRCCAARAAWMEKSTLRTLVCHSLSDVGRSRFIATSLRMAASLDTVGRPSSNLRRERLQFAVYWTLVQTRPEVAVMHTSTERRAPGSALRRAVQVALPEALPIAEQPLLRFA